MNRDDLNRYAEEIEQAANGDLRRKATDARSLYSERGYHDVTAEQAEAAQAEGQQAWQGAMQYAQDLRRQASQMGEGETTGDPRMRDEAEMVEHAAQMAGWLTNDQRGAWDRANNNRFGGGTEERAQLERGIHHSQQEADTARRTGVMVHEDVKPGRTVERIKLVPNPLLPPYKDPAGEVPTNMTRPDNELYPQTGRHPEPVAEPAPAESFFRDKASELRVEAQEKADEAAAEPDHNRQRDLYNEAKELDDAADMCDEQADWESENPTVWMNADEATPEDFGWRPIPVAEVSEQAEAREPVTHTEQQPVHAWQEQAPEGSAEQAHQEPVDQDSADGPFEIVMHGPVKPPYGSDERAGYDQAAAEASDVETSYDDETWTVEVENADWGRSDGWTYPTPSMFHSDDSGQVLGPSEAELNSASSSASTSFSGDVAE